MTKNEAVQVNQIYSIFKRPLFSGHLCKNVYCITHDPYEIKLLNSSLEEILITDSCSRKIDC